MNTPEYFVGRKDEIKRLTEPNWRSRAALAVLYGRRRIGKTALVTHAFRDRTLWKFEGLESAGTKAQLALFNKELARYTQDDTAVPATDWDTALRMLDLALAKYREKSDQPITVFFDEFQWLCEMKSSLVSLFKYHWDNYLSRHGNATFVLCGSISSFIVRKVIKSRALYGRIDIEINLKPLSLPEARQFLPATLTSRECLETYMIFGGVPQYLLEFNPKLSLIQNLNEYAFKPGGYFFQEFERLFVSHFASHPVYEEILKRLAAGTATASEIAAACRLTPGGGLSERLSDLVLAGFIRRSVPVDKKAKSRLLRYQFDDEFLHFYFSLIAPRTADIAAGNIAYTQIADSRQMSQWHGYAFERLCRKHAIDLARHLGFSGINYRYGEWFRRDSKGSGAQVDLLFVRADRVLTVCEIKYVNRLSSASIGTAIEHQVTALREAFPRYGIQRVLITTGTATGQENASRYFDHTVLAENVFLGPP